MIRVYFKERPPVGCIPVVDHLELNVAPLSINLSHSFYLMALRFFFDNSATATTPAATTNDRLQVPNTRSANSTLKRNYQSFHSFGNEELDTKTVQIVLPSPATPSSLRQRLVKKPSQASLGEMNNVLEEIDQGTSSNSLNAGDNNQLKNDEVEIMKQRSANNCVFLCIKIPEIPLVVSYRATDNDKNIKDLKNVSLLFPLFEIHDKTWTWLDLVNALKSHVKKALVS